MDPSAPGWYPDPYGRHERRYWSGIRWSRHVDDGGYRAEDPVDTGPVATVPLVQPPPTTPGWPERQESAEWPRRPDRSARSRGIGFGERRDHSSSQIPRVELAEHSGAHARHAGPGWVFESEERRRVNGPRDRRPLALLAGAVVLALIAGAAVLLLRKGDDDTAPEEISQSDPVMEAVVAALDERALGSVPEEKIHCMAEAMVGLVGKERMIELDVLNGADPVVSASDAEKDVGIPKAFECLDNDELVAFMAHSWRDDNDEPYDPPVADCVFRRWLAGLGRPRLVYLYRTFANLTPPPIDETLNANEYTLAVESLQECVKQHQTTTTPAAP
jgi:hypothetical protein